MCIEPARRGGHRVNHQCALPLFSSHSRVSLRAVRHHPSRLRRWHRCTRNSSSSASRYYFLDALDEELPTVLAPISVHKSAYSALVSRRTRADAVWSGQAEGGKSRILWRVNYSISSALNLALIKNARTWIGQFYRDTFHAYIRGEVPFARPRAKPAQPWPYRRLAVTPSPSRYPGPCLLMPSAWMS